MRVWIDADACPKAAKDQVVRFALKRQFEVLLVAGQAQIKPAFACVRLIVVPSGPDAADDYLVEHAVPGELVICSDVPLADRLVGGTYTPSDEHGDAHVFTQKLAALCGQRGAEMLFGNEITRLEVSGGEIRSATVQDRVSGERRTLQADAFVVACGAYTTPLLRSVGLRVPIYPGKGYSATLPILKPDQAPNVSMLDDGRKIAISRLGNFLRVAGTIELGGFDLRLDTPVAKARCAMLTQRIEELFPGVIDTRSAEQGGNPQFWTGLRPATPTNIPLIGRTAINRLWINAGHGTLGWTHGAGSGRALAELICGERPAMNFGFTPPTYQYGGEKSDRFEVQAST